ncbi:hypothetical protein D3C75_439860 [compost metagenome]
MLSATNTSAVSTINRVLSPARNVSFWRISAMFAEYCALSPDSSESKNRDVALPFAFTLKVSFKVGDKAVSLLVAAIGLPLTTPLLKS